MSLSNAAQRANVITALTSIVETANTSTATDKLLHEHAVTMVEGVLRSARRLPGVETNGVSTPRRDDREKRKNRTPVGSSEARSQEGQKQPKFRRLFPLSLFRRPRRRPVCYAICSVPQRDTDS